MKLIVLGTGSGGATNCYNTCFCIENEGQKFIVDGGGGNQILAQLKKADIKISEIRDVFVSHKHTDHILGIVWLLRKISEAMNLGESGGYVGECNFYGDEETLGILITLRDLLFRKAHMTDRVKFVIVKDGEERDICGMKVKFFDINSSLDKQFGFSISKDGQENFVVFAGDEPLKEEFYERFRGCEWLLHEAFCLDKDEPRFKAYAKLHCTARDAGKIANDLGAKNLVMWHTEDTALVIRKIDYTSDARQEFKGGIFVPDDFDIIELK